jgi:hypothetical protein
MSVSVYNIPLRANSLNLYVMVGQTVVEAN